MVSALCVERQGLGQGDDRACPDRDISSLVLSISDCKLADDVKFPDLIPSLKAWAEYREGHGSTAGMRVLLPVYGGGGEDFDLKFVTAHASLEDQGVDYDEYGRSGAQKAQELVGSQLSCDSSRVYLA